MPETLATYRAQTRRLLHDANAQYWSPADLDVDINKGIAHRDLWSGGSRSYRSNVALTIGQDLYTFAGLFPADTVLDVINVWLIYGSTRVRLDNPPFTELTTRFRPWTTFQNRPAAWARYGAGQVYLAPAPGTAYLTDWDLSVLSTTLVAAGDTDPLQYPYTEPVPYYAAYQACINARRWDLAETFLEKFIQAIRDIEGSRVGDLISAYSAHAGHGTR